MEPMSERLLTHFNQVEKDHWWWAGRRQLIRQLLTGYNPQKILDIGCGTGQTLSFLKTIFPKAKLFGLDQSRTAVRFAQNRGHHLVKEGDALHLPFPKETFDIVLLLDVIEHIQDDRQALTEAKRVLKKRGVILITSPALQFIWSHHDSNQGHQRRYTRTRLRTLAQDLDLEIKFLSYFNYFLSSVIIPVRLVSRFKFFESLTNYDAKINFGIASLSPLNWFLKLVFVTEIKLLQFIHYPIGISVGTLLQKS